MPAITNNYKMFFVWVIRRFVMYITLNNDVILRILGHVKLVTLHNLLRMELFGTTINKVLKNITYTYIYMQYQHLTATQ